MCAQIRILELSESFIRRSRKRGKDCRILPEFTSRLLASFSGRLISSAFVIYSSTSLRNNLRYFGVATLHFRLSAKPESSRARSLSLFLSISLSNMHFFFTRRPLAFFIRLANLELTDLLSHNWYSNFVCTQQGRRRDLYIQAQCLSDAKLSSVLYFSFYCRNLWYGFTLDREFARGDSEETTRSWHKLFLFQVYYS